MNHIVSNNGQEAIAKYAALLRSCEALLRGKLVHELIVRAELESNPFLGGLLIQMYIKCGSIVTARVCFDKMQKKNWLSWNTMICTYAQHHYTQEAFLLYRDMQSQGMFPDKSTFVHLLSACVNAMELNKGRVIHAQIIGLNSEQDVFVGSALIYMYDKCGSVQDAKGTFNLMHKQDAVSWSSMIAAHVNHAEDMAALQLFIQMQQEGFVVDKVTFVSVLKACAHQEDVAKGKQVHALVVGSRCVSNVMLQTALLDMYGKHASIYDALNAFHELVHRDVISWNAIIAAYAHHQLSKEASALYHQMQQEALLPDRVTYIHLLDACAGQTALLKGRMVHSVILSYNYKSDLVLASALVNMYGKCGSLENALNVFHVMSVRNVVTWTNMITLHAQYGYNEDALNLFEKMQLEGIAPNQVTFVGVLSACRHAGLVDTACSYFSSMKLDYGIMPTEEHYDCMIDLFGRSGRLGEAEDLIKKMSPGPTVWSWMALLTACLNHFDVERGVYAANNLFRLDPGNSVPYIMLSNLYVSVGRLRNAEEVRSLMIRKGLRSPELTFEKEKVEEAGDQCVLLFNEMQKA